MKRFIAILMTVALLSCATVTTVLAAGGEDEVITVAVCEKAGDIDLSGTTGAEDARLALRFSVGLETEAGLKEKYGERVMFRADVDTENSDITAADARGILRITVGLDEKPCHAISGVIDEEGSWTKNARSHAECAICGETISELETASKISAMIDDANAWAAYAGVDGFIAGVSENEGADLTLVVNADYIWAEKNINTDAFDGFLTAIGNYVKDNINPATVTLDGVEVYKNGALANTAVKKALFGIGDGFFYKLSKMDAENGSFVYGTYPLTVDGEKVSLAVKLVGTNENLKKIADFSAVIADHVYAETGDDLIIGVKCPDALSEKIANAGGMSRLNDLTVKAGFGILAATDLNEVIGSQVSAVNKLAVTLCGMDNILTKVLNKFADATVKTADGESVKLFGTTAFDPAADSFAGLVNAVAAMFSEELGNTKVGEFKYVADTENENGAYYEIPVHFTVDVSNAGLMSNPEETVIFRIHVAA